MRSKYFEKWKSRYDAGLIGKEGLKLIVGKRTGITAEEYEIITGEPYEA